MANGQVTSPQAQSLVDVRQPDILGGIKTGADLAQRRVQNEFKQQELNIRKDEAKLQRDQFNSQLLQSSISLMAKMDGRSPQAIKAMSKILDRRLQMMGGGLGEVALADILKKDGDVLKQINAIGGQIQKALASGAIDPATASELGQKLASVASKDGGADFAPMIKQFQDQLTGAITQARDIQKIQAQAAEQRKTVETRAKEQRVSQFLQETFQAREAEKDRKFKKGLADAKLTEDKRQFNLQLEQDRKEAAAEALENAMKQEFATAQLNQKLRKEIGDSKEFQAYSEVRMNAKRAITALQSPSPFGDLSAIFGLVKILDPGSVVRNSELGAIEMTGSVGQRFSNLLNRMWNGERLGQDTSAMRKDMINIIDDAWKKSQSSYLDRRAPIMRQAKRLRLLDTDPGSEMASEDTNFRRQMGLIENKKDRDKEPKQPGAGARSAAQTRKQPKAETAALQSKFETTMRKLVEARNSPGANVAAIDNQMKALEARIQRARRQGHNIKFN